MAPALVDSSAPPIAPAQTKKREWAPRIWEGSDFFAWVRLVTRNHFAVHFTHFYIAVIVTMISVVHTLLRWIQRDLYGTKAYRTPIKHSPIFIIGHWRTGTTLMHELMILDERHTFPNTYQCLEPNHFLLTEGFVKKYLSFLMPNRRPMDNMKAGWDRPQEDEFALCMMGVASPYLKIAFPNHPLEDWGAYTIEDLPPKARERWKAKFLEYLRLLTYNDPRRLVLKSPTHSFRIKVLLEMFPEARFIHIVRNPYVVYPSTVNLWKTLHETHGLQKPRNEMLESEVLETFRRLYEKVEEGKQLVSPAQFYELKYEDLTQDPIGEMEKMYKQLELGEFDAMRVHLEEYFKDNAGYRTNKYQKLSDEKREQIQEQWGEVIERYGYEEPIAPDNS